MENDTWILDRDSNRVTRLLPSRRDCAQTCSRDHRRATRLSVDLVILPFSKEANRHGIVDFAVTIEKAVYHLSLRPGPRLSLPAELNFNFVLYLPSVCASRPRDLFARLTDGLRAAKPIYEATAAAFLPPVSPPPPGNPRPIFNFTVSRAEAAKCREKSTSRGLKTSRARGRRERGREAASPGVSRKGCRCSGVRSIQAWQPAP